MDDGVKDGDELDYGIVKQDGPSPDSPVYSRSPFFPRSMVLNGAGIPYPAGGGKRTALTSLPGRWKPG